MYANIMADNYTAKEVEVYKGTYIIARFLYFM